VLEAFVSDFSEFGWNAIVDQFSIWAGEIEDHPPTGLNVISLLWDKSEGGTEVRPRRLWDRFDATGGEFLSDIFINDFSVLVNGGVVRAFYAGRRSLETDSATVRGDPCEGIDEVRVGIAS